MDRIIKITLGLFIIILAGTVGFALGNGYISNAYQSSLGSTYSYSLSITTDHPLTNVTLFVPIPADKEGNSPIVTLYSAGAMPQVPDSWQTVLFDTGKATLLKIHTPAIILPEGTTEANPYTITINADIPANDVIDTADPVANDAVFRPVQDLATTTCMGTAAAAGSPACSTYLTSLYASYTADPGTAVTITSSVTGRNTWKVFEPKSNQYTMVSSVLLHGGTKGWATMKGTLETGAGSYEYPFRVR